MAIIDLLWKVPLTVFGGFAGMAFHELCHFACGYVFGAKPVFERWWFGLPTQVDFEHPGAMSGAQIRITGGVVVLWPILTFSTVGYVLGTGKVGLFPVIVFFGGASAVSWLDMLALTEPDLWHRLTTGAPIQRSDFEN